MFKQYEILSCPFCNIGNIECLYIPSTFTYKRKGRNALGNGKSISRSSEEWIIQSGCNKCGKSQDEVEKEFKRTGFIK